MLSYLALHTLYLLLLIAILIKFPRLGMALVLLGVVVFLYFETPWILGSIKST